jgi:hypothetical protein
MERQEVITTWRKLWGSASAETVDEYYQMTDGQVLDLTQVSAMMRNSDCPHLRVRVTHHLWRAESMYEPAEYTETGECLTCGKVMDGDDIPDDADIVQ